MNYTKHYTLLIEKARKAQRKRTDLSNYENHHIIPRSEGGLDSKENLVLLTPREHFVAHFLLHMEQPTRESRARAFWFMCQDVERRKYIPSSRIYQYARQLVLEVNRTGKIYNCVVCKKEVYRAPSELLEKVFCSTSCHGLYKKDPSLPGSKYKERTGWSPKTKLKMRNMRLGRKLINKDNIQLSVPSKEVPSYLEEGWKLGKGKKAIRKWYTNGIEEKLVYNGKQPPKDWIEGRIIQSQTKGKKAISKDGQVKFVSDPENWISLGWQLGNSKYYPGWKHKRTVVESRKR